MFVQKLDLTTALRPALLQDETLLSLQDAVGLYEGKFKIPDCQNGQAYLTSYRICYVDVRNPRHSSIAIDLKDVARCEFKVKQQPPCPTSGAKLTDVKAGFFKSSPKVVLYPRPAKKLVNDSPSGGLADVRSARPHALAHDAAGSAPGAASREVTWICPICSFSNPVPSNLDWTTVDSNPPLPPCLACGVDPPRAHVLKAAIPKLSDQEIAPASSSPSLEPDGTDGRAADRHADHGGYLASSEDALLCPRCTFRNHASLNSCELCGATLPSRPKGNGFHGVTPDFRVDSPGPSLAVASWVRSEVPESIKLSFRAGGDKTFYDRLQKVMEEKAWISTPGGTSSSDHFHGGGPHAARRMDGDGNGARTPSARSKPVGLMGLERRDLMVRKNNQLVIGNAFEDLQALMASAKELVALAENLSRTVNASSGAGWSEAKTMVAQSATALGLATTRDLLGPGAQSESLYLTELSRTLAEYLTDDATGVLRREGGIMSLVDLWAVFNRARGGVELVSPLDFHKAVGLWETLHLPLRLREFPKSGLLVVQSKDRSDEKTVASIRAWMQTDHHDPASVPDATWDVAAFGRGVSPRDVAERFGWSVGVALEELQMAEERGVLCREEGVEGVRFWENWLVQDAALSSAPDATPTREFGRMELE
ncbi:MAG: hypothetical protein M1826_006013 [Phylliscum demangeonii]|nr:MAG: hypothetical protein M1826_006013 [Phylliscum demangeonii]